MCSSDLSGSGLLSGTPSTAGTYTFVARVTNAGPPVQTALTPTLTIVVAPALVLPGAFGKSSPANGATGVRSPATLKWGTSAGANGYAVCIDADADSTCDSGWIATGTARSLKRSLVASTTYRWQVRATNAGGGTTVANTGTWWQFRTR